MLIVIEGLDGSGKTTQFDIIKRELIKKHSVKAISFHDYDKQSSTLVKMYLNGEISKDACSVNAYAASSFYAVDRYASYKMFWEENYQNGDLIFASRYVSSNAIHQMVKLPESEWNGYLEWLEDYEYEKLGLPRPDMVIFLDMPVEISQRLMTERYNGDESRKDIHETDFEYLKACRRSALYASEKLGWKIVKCSMDNRPLAIEEISRKLLELINKICE